MSKLVLKNQPFTSPSYHIRTTEFPISKNPMQFSKRPIFRPLSLFDVRLLLGNVDIAFTNQFFKRPDNFGGEILV